MQIVAVSDVHIDMGRHAKPLASGLPDAWASAHKCWMHACRYAAENGADAFLLTGDAFRNGWPTPEAAELLGEGMRMLSKAGVPVIAIPGNHENISRPRGYRHALERFEALAGVEIVSDARVVTLRNGLAVATMPWPSPRWLLEPGDTDGKERSEVRELVEAAAKAELARLASSLPKDVPALLVGHLAVAEATPLRGSELTLGSVPANEPMIGLSDLEQGPWASVVLGHVHRRQALSDRVHYVGSSDAHDYGDEGQDKAASVISINSAMQATVEALPLPARRLFSLTWDGADVAIPEGALVRITLEDASQEAEARKAVADAGGRVTTVRIARPDSTPSERDSEAAKAIDPSAWVDAWMQRRGLDGDFAAEVRAEALARMEGVFA